MNLRSLEFLQSALERIDPLIRLAVSRAQEAGHDPTDPLRGLIISDDEINAQMTRKAIAGLWTAKDAEQISLPVQLDEDPQSPFMHIVRMFRLSVLDAHILLLCLAPELDRRYERLYAYLQDDVSLRRPTVNLLMNLLGNTVPQRFTTYQRLSEQMPLRKHKLIDCIPESGQSQRSFLSYHVRVDHRIVAFLLGDMTPDSRLMHVVRQAEPQNRAPIDADKLEPIAQMFTQSPLIYMQGKLESGQVETGSSLCTKHQIPLIVVDAPASLLLNSPFELVWRIAIREALLANGALMINGWEAWLNEADQQPDDDLWKAIIQFPYPIFLCGTKEWEPKDETRERVMLRLNFSVPHFELRRHTWAEALARYPLKLAEIELNELSNKFRFKQVEIERAVRTAQDLALSSGESLNLKYLYQGAQAHAHLDLGQYAERVHPRYDWDDLILPPEQLQQLHEIEARARLTHIVHDSWAFGKKVKPVPGVSALFAGDSGTGKTMSAEVLGKNLGLMLYKIDLSAVVSKYIGETEKNLGVIFDAAQASNAILFFDEADALFGKRSEVKDARDRYANIEIAYLLQKIESYDGIAILATNLRQNLDDAFTRRIDFMIDFPFPEPLYRQRIWQAHFPEQAPLGTDVDFSKMADQYELAGGNIRNVALASAYLAADDGGVITRRHIQLAIRREHQKMGRLLDDGF